ncbi:MAG: guanylate kinase [Pseudomonadales bacterium]|jgi:guanylate kinase|nr:guanylate kinase [Pseudomonadales bacterium]MCC6529555.1 guanylate kinase [Pseudomonadales bacterium]MCP5332758.1 guanylate kinase [Pseudomonadales bacterium]HMU90786.1 guanylate kinase [Pseudomonadales bacterium]HMW14973.1 guanylate kinase [Pseudomonadales bacterium]
MPTGQLYIISAPSGAGKTSLVKALLEQDSDLAVSVSHTTRPRRVGEVDGVNYHFITTQQFLDLLAQDAFLEHAEVFGHYYGTSHLAVARQLERGQDVILEIDWQGARQVRRLIDDAVSIFILPPSRAELERRLTARGQDGVEVISARMAKATAEMSHYPEFDYLLINDSFERALTELQAIVLAKRLELPRQSDKARNLIAELLS